MTTQVLADCGPRMAALAVQSISDVRASTFSELAHCQQRYLLHQAYEKAIKALLLSYRDAHYRQVQTDPRQQDFLDQFNRALDKSHHPLSEISTNRKLRPIWYMMQTFAKKRNLDLDLIRTVDGYPQSADHEAVHLRYPFLLSNAWRAPSSLTVEEWETLLGPWEPQRKAVAKMVQQVDLHVKAALRSP